jgi:hypothetical protein
VESGTPSLAQSKKPKEEGSATGTLAFISPVTVQPAITMSINLDQLKDIRVVKGDKVIIIRPEEIWAALNDKPILN